MPHVTMAAHQPNHWPHLGFWDKMRRADVFVILDHAQFTRSDFHHRQRIRSAAAAGWSWLTVPTDRCSHRETRPIRAVRIPPAATIKQRPWHAYHLDYIEAQYASAPYLDDFRAALHDLYADPPGQLTDFNLRLIDFVRDVAGLRADVIRTSELDLEPPRGSAGIVAIARQLGVARYLSGPGARTQASFDEADFAHAGLELTYQEARAHTYAGVDPAAPPLGVLDALLLTGGVPA